ncbi:phytanoyl-CoA dioxygenase family protein [Burkholderia sp. Leaf177]|uniref:phytanoyl-CoA dioxygenase family protein n=1 Tax=Burkholderia sp. Leaf177 TaxID=1736287 RepID=UPI0009E8AFA1|nr:phytanoyl-CoA dioxygenase family protein [Burkholderia sp. Leaf177]
MDITTFDREMDAKGWVIFPGAIEPGLVDRLRHDCLKWIDICTQYQVASGINAQGDGTAHHSVGAEDSIDEFIGLHVFHAWLQHYFESKPYILHACNPVGGFPRVQNYVHRVHRDVATFIPDYRLRINMLVMLDDFTLENGATRVLSGSHRQPVQPGDDEFNARSEPLTGRAGSVVLFNSYLWHKGTLNTTSRNRVALTLSYGPAFVKPQMDYARLIGEDRGAALSPLTRQVLGFNSRVPVSLAEWYRPRPDRLYLPDQG